MDSLLLNRFYRRKEEIHQHSLTRSYNVVTQVNMQVNIASKQYIYNRINQLFVIFLLYNCCHHTKENKQTALYTGVQTGTYSLHRGPQTNTYMPFVQVHKLTHRSPLYRCTDWHTYSLYTGVQTGTHTPFIQVHRLTHILLLYRCID